MALMLMVLAQPALAYKLYDCGSEPARWPGAAVAFSVSTESFPSSGTLQAAVEESIDLWDESEIPGSSLGVSHGLTAVTSSNPRDGINIVAATYIDDCASVDTLGGTDYRGTMGCEGSDTPKADIVEADVYINACWWTWDSNFKYYDFRDAAVEAGEAPVRSTVLHEVGHAVGLDHSYSNGSTGPVAATMNRAGHGGSLVGDAQFLDNDFWQVGEDDRDGLRALYPDGSSTGIDVAVQLYAVNADRYDTYPRPCDWGQARPLPTINDLSARAVEEGLDADDCPSDKSTPAPDLPMKILAGADLDIVYALVNLGTETVESPTWVQLVPTSGSGTTLLHFHTPTLSPDAPYVVEQTVTIPSDLESGTYNVVIETDYGDILDEVDETNNSGVWNLQVEVYGCSCSSGGRGALAMPTLLVLGLMVFRRRQW